MILGGCKGADVGSYSDSPGVEVIRRHVAKYIEERDGGIDSIGETSCCVQELVKVSELS